MNHRSRMDAFKRLHKFIDGHWKHVCKVEFIRKGNDMQMVLTLLQPDEKLKDRYKRQTLHRWDKDSDIDGSSKREISDNGEDDITFKASRTRI